MTPLAKLNAFYDQKLKEGEDPWDVETARAMMYGYFMKYEREDADVVVRGIEVPFCIELPVPDDLPEYMRPIKPRYIGGIIDSIIERSGEIHATDMKTAGYVSPDYWTELHTNPQLTQYQFVLYAAGYSDAGLEWDVVAKPGIEPKKLTIAAKEEIESLGTYCGWPVGRDVPGDGRESPELYGRRVMNWYEDNPTKFERRFYRRNEAQLLEFIYNEHFIQFEMEQSLLRGGDRSCSQKNFKACLNFGSICEYHPLCMGCDNARTLYQHRALKADDKPELGVTPSQEAIFQSCRQKWLYRYGTDPIEPIVKKKTASQRLGTLCHAGREIILAERLQNPIVLPLEKTSVSS